MTAAEIRRTRRDRLASNDERKGGGFPLPALISAAVHVVMDAGNKGAPIDSITEAVRKWNSNETRPQHVWKADSPEESFRLQTEDLVIELLDQGYMQRVDGGDSFAVIAEKLYAKSTPDGGYRVSLNLRPNGTHQATVWTEKEREAINKVSRERMDANSVLHYFTRPRLREERVEELRESMEMTGYDPHLPILVGPEGDTIAGHHREEAARRAGVTPTKHWITDPGEAVLAAFRANDARRWRTDELKHIAVVLRAQGHSQAVVGKTLNVGQKTISRWEAEHRATNNQPRKTKPGPAPITEREDIRARVIELIQDGVKRGEIVRRIKQEFGVGSDSALDPVFRWARESLRDSQATNSEPSKPQQKEPEEEPEPEIDPAVEAAIEVMRKLTTKQRMEVCAQCCNAERAD